MSDKLAIIFVRREHQNGQGYPTAVCHLHYQKAFDSFNYMLQLSKLGSLNTAPSVTRWIANNLRGHRLRVRIGEAQCSASSACRGVPRGSVSGQLMLLVFPNDLTAEIKVLFVR